MLTLAAITILILCVLVLVGLPIIVSLTASVLFYLTMSEGWSLALPQQTLAGISDYILITMPLFILAGGIMNASGIADRLFDFAGALVGWMRGGLAHVGAFRCGTYRHLIGYRHTDSSKFPHDTLFSGDGGLTGCPISCWGIARLVDGTSADADHIPACSS